MPKEIERKYLIQNDSWKEKADEGSVLKQGYLSTDAERTVRVRLIKDRGVLTIKSKSVGITRSEYEYEIPYTDCLELLNLCKKPIIEKVRYLVIENGQQWEIDIFEGENEGLEVAEIELANEAEEVIIPSWLGAEVSDDKRYFNSSLVKHPFCKW